MHHYNQYIFEIQQEYKSFDIIFLENPSKYSNKILELSKKYNIKHYIYNKNIGGVNFQHFITNEQELLKNYKYICLTESDVILDNNVINESINIMTKYNGKLCYTGLNVNLKKYLDFKKLITSWIPKKIEHQDYNIGHTGIQFITFNSNYLLNFIKALNNKKLIHEVALGVKNYEFLSDSNLYYFNKKNNETNYQTKNNLLDHIGWETLIGNYQEYAEFKKKYIKNVRTNIDLAQISYKLI